LKNIFRVKTVINLALDLFSGFRGAIVALFT
jgi:hypothetical protein